MRKLSSMIVFGVLISAGLIQAQSPGTSKADTQWKCAVPTPVHALPVGDAAGHAYVIQQVKCTAAKGEIGGVKEKEGTATEFVEATGNNSKGHGIFVSTLANGDKVTYTYTLSGTSKDEKLVSGSNKWTVTSGMGKFKGLTGSGTCTAKGAADGTAVFDCTGTYTMK
jgi:hypothetical protein